LKDFNLTNDAHFDVVENDVSRLQLFQEFVDVKGAGLQRLDQRHIRRRRFDVVVVDVLCSRHGVVGPVDNGGYHRRTFLSSADVFKLASLFWKIVGQDRLRYHPSQQRLGSEVEEVLDLLSDPEVGGQD